MPRASTTAELFEEITGNLGLGNGVVVQSDELLELFTTLLTEHAHPEYETAMVPQEGPPLTYAGVAGFHEAMSDWLSPWREFRFEVEEIFPVDDMIVSLVRQVGTTKHGGVQIETASAAIWWAPQGRVRRGSFYLDRRTALEAAGLDPDRQPGG